MNADLGATQFLSQSVSQSVINKICGLQMRKHKLWPEAEFTVQNKKKEDRFGFDISVGDG